MARTIMARRPRTARLEAPRSNKYAGTCRRCGTLVPAEAGFLLKDGARWVVEHRLGGCAPASAAPVIHEAPKVVVENLALDLGALDEPDVEVLLAQADEERADDLADEYAAHVAETRATRLAAIDERFGLTPGLRDIS